jgi:hypothetical protein
MWPICIAPWLTLKIEPLFPPESHFWELPYESWRSFLWREIVLACFSYSFSFGFSYSMLFWMLFWSSANWPRLAPISRCTEHTELLAPWLRHWGPECGDSLCQRSQNVTSHITSPHSSNISNVPNFERLTGAQWVTSEYWMYSLTCFLHALSRLVRRKNTAQQMWNLLKEP